MDSAVRRIEDESDFRAALLDIRSKSPQVVVNNRVAASRKRARAIEEANGGYIERDALKKREMGKKVKKEKEKRR